MSKLQFAEWSDQRLREEFWYWESRIRKSREMPKGDASADKMYGEARNCLTEVAVELGKRYEDEELFMEDEDGNYRSWQSYL